MLQSGLNFATGRTFMHICYNTNKVILYNVVSTTQNIC